MKHLKSQLEAFDDSSIPVNVDTGLPHNGRLFLKPFSRSLLLLSTPSTTSSWSHVGKPAIY
jgi:hypothetical protein